MNHDGFGNTERFQPSKMVKTLLGFLRDLIDIVFPFEVIRNMGAQEFECFDNLNFAPIDDKWEGRRFLDSEIDNEFFCFIYIELKIVCVTPIH